MTRLPTFVCVGAQKAGTTSLHDILRQHPSIHLPPSKETKFFCNDELFARGADFYAQFFAGAADRPVVGEIDPDCLYHPEAAARMRQTLGPGLRVIVMLRNPADRAYSHYLMSRSRGYETEPFQVALEREAERLSAGAFEREHFSYLARGRYSEQIERYLGAFGRDRLHVVLFEADFLGDRDATVRRLLAFVGASDASLDTQVRSNLATEPRVRWIQNLFYGSERARGVVRAAVGSPAWKTRLRVIVERWNARPAAVPRLTPEVRERVMRDYFAAETPRLEELLGRSLDSWRDSNADR